MFSTFLYKKFALTSAIKTPVTLYCDPTALARRFEFSQSAVGSHENTKKYSE